MFSKNDDCVWLGDGGWSVASPLGVRGLSLLAKRVRRGALNFGSCNKKKTLEWKRCHASTTLPHDLLLQQIPHRRPHPLDQIRLRFQLHKPGNNRNAAVALEAVWTSG